MSGLAALDREGFCHLQGVLPRAEAECLRAVVEGLATRIGSRHVLGAAYLHPRLTDLAVDPHLLALVTRALSPNVHLYHSHLDVHRADESRQAGGWHRDGGRMNGDLGVSARVSGTGSVSAGRAGSSDHAAGTASGGEPRSSTDAVADPPTG